jgi:hypothetical protein
MASSSSAHYGTSVPDANHRRKWDVAEYEQKARERQSTLKDEKDGVSILNVGKIIFIFTLAETTAAKT